jgi:hypothetical protein
VGTGTAEWLFGCFLARFPAVPAAVGLAAAVPGAGSGAGADEAAGDGAGVLVAVAPAAAPLAPAGWCLPLTTLAAGLMIFGFASAPDTDQARTPKMASPATSAMNRLRQYVADDPFPLLLLNAFIPIR